MAATQPQVSGGQLSSILPYSGNPGLEGLAFIEAVDRGKDQFTWTEMQTTQAAISRGGNAVANWIRGEKAAGITYNNWNAAPANGIELELELRFIQSLQGRPASGTANYSKMHVNII